jgi:glycolate oxidase
VTPGMDGEQSGGLGADVVGAIVEALGPEAVIREPEQLRTYECDGLTGHRVVPALVALPASTEEVQTVVRICHRHGVPFVARGAGTGLSGGALPVAEGIVISVARMNRILEIDLEGGRVTVEPGVTNLEVTQAVADDGFYYAPDPSSQQVCTIGGNVAENSGGAHCLKHGFTVTHVTGLQLVLPDGEVVELGGQGADPDGPDLMGVFIGAEGTLGIATRITLRILRKPEAVQTLLAGFPSTSAAGAAVSGVIAAGILAGAMEIMDRLTIEAAEASVQPGYPDAGAVLIVELDGNAVQVEDDVERVRAICTENGATEIRVATNDVERALFWKGRKAAFAAMGRVSHDYYVQDGVVPRTRLPEVLERIAALELDYGLRVGNVFHAGDGNLHPLVLYDRRNPGEPERRSSPRRSSRCAWTWAEPSPASTASVWTKPAGCRSCSRRSTSRPCSDCGAPSIPRASAIRARSSPRRGSAVRCPGPTGLIRSSWPGSPSASEMRVEPESVAAAAEALAGAAREGKRVSIERDGGDIVLSTRRLDRVLEHEAGDLTATVEAGVTLSALARRLAQHGQMLPLDPPGDPTVGACLAGALSGPRRHRYGAARDLLLGVTVVLADGTAASSGGKVVKNVAGYDLGKLFCGSRGRLGLIARASLRLYPAPAAVRTLVAPVGDAGNAFELCQALHRSQLVPSAVDLLWRRGGGSRLAVMFEGSERAVASQLGAAAELLGGEEAGHEVWDEARAAQTGATRAPFAPGELVHVLDAWEEALIRPGVGSAYVGGDAPAPDPAVEGLAERIRAAFDPQRVLA